MNECTGRAWTENSQTWPLALVVPELWTIPLVPSGSLFLIPVGINSPIKEVWLHLLYMKKRSLGRVKSRAKATHRQLRGLGFEHWSIWFQSPHTSLCFCPECASHPRPLPCLQVGTSRTSSCCRNSPPAEPSTPRTWTLPTKPAS